nr:unnamed protein product [Digitaria exilis]
MTDCFSFLSMASVSKAPVLVLHGLGRGDDVREVGFERLVLVLLVEADLVRLDLETAPSLGAAAGGARGPRGRVVPGDEAPGVLDTVVDVDHLLALLHAHHDALRLVDAADAEARHVGGDPGGEVGARGVVDLVGREALGLVDDHRVARREDAGAEVAPGGVEQGTSSFTTLRTTMAVAATDAAMVMYFS